MIFPRNISAHIFWRRVGNEEHMQVHDIRSLCYRRTSSGINAGIRGSLVHVDDLYDAL